jgi:superfamily II DNA/RNA helicase
METFAELGIDAFLTESLAARGITAPTEIQRLVIPLLLRQERSSEGGSAESVIFSSPAGTGKTFAYLLPLLQAWLSQNAAAASPVDSAGPRNSQGPKILICAPTYELCSQIKREADFLLGSAHPAFRTGLFIGGAALTRQIEALKRDKPRAVIGNPGRLLQLARTGKLKLGSVEALVLDEGDRLTENELFDATRELVSLLNSRRLTAACSATLPPRSLERLTPLAGGGPKIISANSGGTLSGAIEHWAFFSEERRKISLLRSLLAASPDGKTLVFTSRPWQAENIASQLRYRSIPAAALHGGMDKKERKRALDDFRRAGAAVLVTSDLAARGLDIPGIARVIALDTGENPDSYLHRAGRTGRAGASGLMITIGDERELSRLAKLEKKLGVVIYPKELRGGKAAVPGDY